MLNLFAHIRGVPTAQRHKEIEKWIDFVGMTFAVSHLAIDL